MSAPRVGLAETPPAEKPLVLGGKIRALLQSPWTMVGIALILRLVVMGLVYKMHLDPSRDHFLFGAEIGRVARSLVTGRGFSSPFPDPSGPTAFIPPVYPVLLAGIFKLFGVYTAASAIAALTVQSVFSALTCVPIFLMARRVFGLRLAAWAGWVWAFFPFCFYVSDMAIWETTLTTLLMALLVLASLQLEQSTSSLAWGGYGLLWGVAVLTNPATIAPLPFLGGWLWLRHRGRGSNCTPAAIAASVVFLAAVAPWMWRCSALYGRFVPFRGGMGIQFLVGSSSNTTLPINIYELPSSSPPQMTELQRVGEPEYMASKQREAFDLISRDPLRYAKLCLRRILFTWTAFWKYPSPWTLDGVGWPMIMMYSSISLLALTGLGLALRNRPEGAVPLAIVVVVYPIVYYLTAPSMRYRHPIDPVLTIFLAYAVTSLRWRTNEFRSATQIDKGLGEPIAG